MSRELPFFFSLSLSCHFAAFKTSRHNWKCLCSRVTPEQQWNSHRSLACVHQGIANREKGPRAKLSMQMFYMINGLHWAFPAPSRYHQALYSGLSFTPSYTNGWRPPCKALSSPTGSNPGLSVLLKDTCMLLQCVGNEEKVHPVLLLLSVTSQRALIGNPLRFV